MAKFIRVHSTPDQLEYWDKRVNQCLCYFYTDNGTRKHGIVHKVFASRKFDAVHALVASDEGVFLLQRYQFDRYSLK